MHSVEDLYDELQEQQEHLRRLLELKNNNYYYMTREEWDGTTIQQYYQYSVFHKDGHVYNYVHHNYHAPHKKLPRYSKLLPYQNKDELYYPQ